MESKPVKTIPVHESLNLKLCDLYESDHIFDKFEVSTSGDGKYVLTNFNFFEFSYFMTGSYSNYLYVIDRTGKTPPASLLADKAAFKAASSKKTQTKTSKFLTKGKSSSINPVGSNGSSPSLVNTEGNSAGTYLPPPDQIDFNKRIIHCSWHPKEPIIAVAGTNNLFIFGQNESSK